MTEAKGPSSPGSWQHSQISYASLKGRRVPPNHPRAQAAHLHKWGTTHSPGLCCFGPGAAGVLSGLPLLASAGLAESLSWIQACEKEWLQTSCEQEALGAERWKAQTRVKGADELLWSQKPWARVLVCSLDVSDLREVISSLNIWEQSFYHCFQVYYYFYRHNTHLIKFTLLEYIIQWF